MNQPQSIALFFPEIRELLAEKNYTLLKQVMKACSPLDFADVWKKFTEEERLQVFKLLPANSALKLFEILPLEDQRFLLAKLNEESVTPILENLNSPDLAKIFHRMPARAVKKMTSLIKRQEALAQIDIVMKYPENTVGSQMHPEFIRLAPKMTANQALNRLQAITRPGQKEHLYSLFVTDEDMRLLGTVSLQDLVSAPEDEQLYELMGSCEQIKLKPEMDQEEAARIFSKYDLSYAPVVGSEDRLLGVLTVKDIVSVIRQEAAEDIAKIAGTKVQDINERSAFRIVRFRSPWLIVTLVGGTFKSFEPLLSQIIALASFSPLIAGMGGNVGSQSATVVVRQLAMGQVAGSAKKLQIVLREMGVGILMGTLYGTVLGVVAFGIYGETYGYHFSIVVGSAMLTAMTIAATMGAVGPLLFDNFGIDPATAAGPIVSTTTDIFSNLIYFSMAAWLLWHH
jgi:magnesium transporter